MDGVIPNVRTPLAKKKKLFTTETKCPGVAGLILKRETECKTERNDILGHGTLYDIDTKKQEIRNDTFQ